MAPKRKAPLSGTTPAPRAGASSKPAPPSANNKKRGGGGAGRQAPQPKKARVDVEYDDEPSGSKKSKGKGKGPAAPPTPKVLPAPKPVEDVAVASTSQKANSKGKKLAFASTPEVDALPAASAPKPSALKPRQPTGPKTFQVIAGSYEKLLYGLQGVFPEPGQEADYSIKPIFIFPAHQACVKTVAAAEGGKWLATGAGDEVVKIWDLKRRKEVGGLQQHTGSITSLQFPSRTHLITASEDSTITLFRSRDWTVLRSFKGHVGRVNSVAVHPTGKLALSLGKDRTLKVWDLMKGKAGGSTKLGKEGEIVRFSQSGSLFAVLCTNTIDLYNTDMSPLCTLTNPKRFHDFHFVTVPASTEGGEKRELLVAAVEEGYVRVYEFAMVKKEAAANGVEGWSKAERGEWTEIARLVGHKHRVKSLSPLYPLVATVSSDGFINLYDLASLPLSSPDLAELEPVSKYDTKGTRLTCVTLAEGGALAEGGEESSSEEEESSDDEEEEEEELDSEFDEELEGEEEDEDEEEME